MLHVLRSSAGPTALLVLLFAPALHAANEKSVSSWHTFLGSSGEDSGSDIVVDTSGNVYVAGESVATWGTPVNPHAGGYDIFAAKLSSSGVLQWNTFLGSASQDRNTSAIAVDTNGNVYVAGRSDATWGSPLSPHAGEEDVFLAKLNPDGIRQWNIFMGAQGSKALGAIAVDTNGNVYVTGVSDPGWTDDFWGTPVNPPDMRQEAFAVKLSSTGAPHWYTFMGGEWGDVGNAIAVDASGNVYVSGWSEAAWGSPVNDHTGDGEYEGFAAKLNSSGVRQWNTFFGGENADESHDIGVDSSGNVTLSGHSMMSWGTPINPHAGGYWDAFAVKLNSSGIREWNTFLGGLSDDFGWGINLNTAGDIYVAGMSCETWGLPINPFAGQCDASVAKLDPNGVRQWNTFVGSEGFEGSFASAVDTSWNIFLAGWGDTSWGTPVNPHAGGLDAVVAKIESTIAVFNDGFESGDTSAWTNTVP